MWKRGRSRRRFQLRATVPAQWRNQNTLIRYRPYHNKRQTHQRSFGRNIPRQWVNREKRGKDKPLSRFQPSHMMSRACHAPSWGNHVCLVFCSADKSLRRWLVIDDGLCCRMGNSRHRTINRCEIFSTQFCGDKWVRDIVRSGNGNRI